MTEIEFRIESLKLQDKIYKGRNIAVYGLGANAKVVLDELQDENVVALLDEKCVGQYKYGKLVISLEEALLLGVDIIIIAAEMVSSAIISKRILPFCLQNQITLLNMYGKNEKELHRKLLECKKEYINYSEDNLREQIEHSEVICVELMDILCNMEYCDEVQLFKAFEKKYDIQNFVENRLNAEKQISRAARSIQDIYKCYASLVYPNNVGIKELCEKEEQFWIESLIPHKKMVSIVNDAILNGKIVHIVSNMKISQKNNEKLFEKLGLFNCKNIIQQNLGGKSFSNGAIRYALGNDFGKKTLYIGTEQGYNSILALSYDMEFVLFKGPIEIMKSVSDTLIDNKNMSEDSYNSFVKYIHKKTNSLFIKDFGNLSLGNINLNIDSDWQNKSKENITKQLFDDIEITELKKLPPIVFPKVEVPKVSIIIPVYNQFGYTYNCLRSILKNTINVDYEIIIADDCSSDETQDIEQIVKGIKYIRNAQNLLFLRNCNNAVKLAIGEYIVFLNNDTQVLYNWLAPMVHLMEADSNIGLVGSKLIFPDGTLQEAGGIIWSDGSGANYGRGQNPDLPEYNYVREVDYVSGASIIIKKTLWNEIGGFDERFVPAYCEDSDLAFEVRKHGKKVVFQPASKVVHYEGISNGKETTEGIKKYQMINQNKLEEKWRSILKEEHYSDKKDLFLARERKGKRKTILFFSHAIPSPDCDAGSVTVFNYLKLFIKKGYIVKFVPANFMDRREYSFMMKQMGIEVLCGDYYKERFDSWLLNHKDDIEFAFINYPSCGEQFIDLLKCTNIKIRYYGHDLHYLRKQREYELHKDERELETSKKYYKEEKHLIEEVEIVYYPSEVEVDIVKQEFNKESVKAVPAYIFDSSICRKEYTPNQRSGIMYIGGYAHLPNVDAVLWFANEIYPQISMDGQIPFYIVGSNEPSSLRKLDAPGIVHKGYVTDEELNRLYEEVKLVIVPLRYGAGVKGKIIDAMYRCVPIVSTTVGIEGIQEAENYIDIADDADTFAKKVIELYYNDDRLVHVVKNYGKIITKYFSEEAVWNIIQEDF